MAPLGLRICPAHDDDDNLIVFPPKADDNSYTLNQSIPVQ